MLQILTTNQNKPLRTSVSNNKTAKLATAVLLSPRKVQSFKRSSYTHVKQNRLDAVAEVNETNVALFTGKIETKARFLAMRFACEAAGVHCYFSQVPSFKRPLINKRPAKWT